MRSQKRQTGGVSTKKKTIEIKKQAIAFETCK